MISPKMVVVMPVYDEYSFFAHSGVNSVKEDINQLKQIVHNLINKLEKQKTDFAEKEIENAKQIQSLKDKITEIQSQYDEYKQNGVHIQKPN